VICVFWFNKERDYFELFLSAIYIKDSNLLVLVRAWLKPKIAPYQMGNRVEILTVCEASVSKVLSVLSHPLRREVLYMLHEKGECSFTDLLNALNIDTGKLSFHLRTLSTFMEQTPTGKYKLNRNGESAIRVIMDVESWAEGADVSRRALNLPLASFKRRTYAFLIDFALILGITALFGIPELFPLLLGTPFGLDLSTLPFIALVLVWGYSSLLEGFNGQTLGKRIVGLKAVRVDGKRMAYEHSAVRNFGKAFLLPFDLLVGLKHEKYLRYFDKFAGTTVIDLRAQQQPLPISVDKTCEKELKIASPASQP
jgi:uncharacterized RDD family membrane protein YckC/DNA-binding HxlR family transcriptional regulator